MNTQKRLRWYNDYETETIREVWKKEKKRERERERGYPYLTHYFEFRCSVS